MKIPNEVFLEIVQIMSLEELLRLRKRLSLKVGQKLKEDTREHLTEMLSAEIKRREELGQLD